MNITAENLKTLVIPATPIGHKSTDLKFVHLTNKKTAVFMGKTTKTKGSKICCAFLYYNLKSKTGYTRIQYGTKNTDYTFADFGL